MRKTSPAATAKDPASKRKGRAKVIERRKLPTTGPTKVLATSSALHMRPLAFSRSEVSTRLGMIVCPQLSRSTSAMPSSRVATSSTA